MSTHWNNEHFKGREFVPGTIGILFLLLSLTHSPQRTQSWNDAGGGTVLLLLCWRAPFVGAVLWQWSNAAALQQLIKQQWWSFSTSVGCFNENTLKLSVLICWGNNVWNGPHAVDITSLKALSKAWWNHYYYYHFFFVIIIIVWMKFLGLDHKGRSSSTPTQEPQTEVSSVLDTALLSSPWQDLGYKKPSCKAHAVVMSS